MRRNLGDTALPRRRRPGHPMQAFDRAPAPLRRWLAQAALPWSVESAWRIFDRARKAGADEQAALARLTRIEAAMLTRADQNGRSRGRVEDSGLQ